MQTLQQNKKYAPSIPYLIFLRDAIKEGYKPTPEEKALLKKYILKATREHPRAGFAVTQKMEGE
ncbi:MAG: hypothetical protein AABW68_04880 [archaeon]